MLPTQEIEGLIPKITRTSLFIQEVKRELEEAEAKMKSSPDYMNIEWLKYFLNQYETQEKELREQGKKIMLENWLKKFEMLDWTTIQLNSTPGALVIAEGVQLDPKYYKEKTTVTMDKVQVKKDFMDWLIMDPGVTIESDFKFIIKSK